MKKLLAVLIVATLVVTGVFADVTANQEGYTMTQAESLTSQAEVKLELNRADMYYYAFGFSNSNGQTELKDTSVDKKPSYTGALALTYDPKTSTATNAETENNLYFWYKARTADNFSVTFSIDGPLTDSKNNNPSVEWKAEIAYEEVGSGKEMTSISTTTISSSGYPELGTTSTKGTVENSSKDEEYLYGAYKITATTDVIPLLETDAIYGATLSLKVSAN